jgi:hypothetical protein
MASAVNKPLLMGAGQLLLAATDQRHLPIKLQEAICGQTVGNLHEDS